MTSRVSGYSDGFEDGRPDFCDQQERRRRRFIKEYRRGDTVYGVPVRPGPGQLTWVDINGHLLLADIGSNTQVPVLRFQVEAVEPEIILKIQPDGQPDLAVVSSSRFPIIV